MWGMLVLIVILVVAPWMLIFLVPWYVLEVINRG